MASSTIASREHGDAEVIETKSDQSQGSGAPMETTTWRYRLGLVMFVLPFPVFVLGADFWGRFQRLFEWPGTGESA